jgi:hypothetical protein
MYIGTNIRYKNTSLQKLKTFLMIYKNTQCVGNAKKSSTKLTAGAHGVIENK